MVAVAAVLSTVVAGGEGAGAANALPWWGNRPKGAARRRRRGQAQSQAFPIWSAGEAVPRAGERDGILGERMPSPAPPRGMPSPGSRWGTLRWQPQPSKRPKEGNKEGG